jgi:hypothetical protein
LLNQKLLLCVELNSLKHI